MEADIRCWISRNVHHEGIVDRNIETTIELEASFENPKYKQIVTESSKIGFRMHLQNFID